MVGKSSIKLVYLLISDINKEVQGIFKSKAKANSVGKSIFSSGEGFKVLPYAKESKNGNSILYSIINDIPAKSAEEFGWQDIN